MAITCNHHIKNQLTCCLQPWGEGNEDQFALGKPQKSLHWSATPDVKHCLLPETLRETDCMRISNMSSKKAGWSNAWLLFWNYKTSLQWLPQIWKFSISSMEGTWVWPKLGHTVPNQYCFRSFRIVYTEKFGGCLQNQIEKHTVRETILAGSQNDSRVKDW